jgi:hypothetical protein
MSNNVDGDRPLSPLVQQLKKKFDRMSANNLTKEHSKSHSQSHIHRVGNNEGDGGYALLPVCCFIISLTLFHKKRLLFDFFYMIIFFLYKKGRR